MWGNSMTQGDRDKFDRIFRRAGRIVGSEQQTMTELTEKRMTQKLQAILNDETHPLREEFDSMIIQRTGRLRLPKVKTTRYQKSLFQLQLNFLIQILKDRFIILFLVLFKHIYK